MSALSMAVAVVGVLGVVSAASGPAEAQSAQARITRSATEGGIAFVEGRLADGTPFLVRKPSNWNGVVVRDLDGVLRRDEGVYQLLLKAGYGTAAAHRRSFDRAWTLNRLDDVRRPQEALEIFTANFGRPKLAIAFGRSAGGSSALLTSERHPDTIDGAVALCATMDFVAYAGYNSIFDFFYTLRTLLAPNDEKLVTHALPADTKDIREYWLNALKVAARTPEGRARIALAYAIAQYPVYGTTVVEAGVPKPNLDDPDAVMEAMIQSLPRIVGRLNMLGVTSEKDFPPDLEIRGTPQPNVVGNDGAVYADYWKNADPLYKRVTQALYAKAGVDLAADIETIDAAPRARTDRALLEQGLLGRGLPTTPVFRMDNLGDQIAPPNVSKLYDALVSLNGLDHLYRTSYVDNGGHCYFTPQQEFVAVEVMRERLQTGKWPATDTAALNARVGTDDPGGRVFLERPFGPYTGVWRLRTFTDLFEPVTFGRTSALVSGYFNDGLLTQPQKAALLADLSAMERAGAKGRAEQAGLALDRFSATVKGIENRVARTRLLAAAHRLGGAL